MAVVFSIQNEAGNIVAVWEIVENEDDLIKKFPFNDKMTSQIIKFRNQSRKLEWLASRALLYQYTGLIPNVEYKEESGQPYIQGFNKNISITHTVGYAAIAISDSSPAGVDIERPRERILRVAKKFVHPDEYSYIPKNKEISYYTLIWCAKETLFKMIKRGGVIFNEELYISPFNVESEGVLNAKESNGTITEYILQYITTPDFYLVWHY